MLQRHSCVQIASCGARIAAAAIQHRAGSGTCHLRPPAPAKTTYEGNDDECSYLRRSLSRSLGFTRSTFVPERRCAEDLRKKYDIGPELGSGATCRVFKAVNKRTLQEVAVKSISKEHVSDPVMLQNEIAIQKATDHPNILRLLETFEDECTHYLVMELCHGGDLWRFLSANSDEYSTLPMAEKQAIQIFHQVVNSVVYLHSQGIVHRDLKPGNFLLQALGPPQEGGPLQRTRIIKLADFGVSAYATSKHRLTRRVGTDGFMAPEILKNQPYDAKADVFSMGCILHMLLTGHPPKMHPCGQYGISKVRLNFCSQEARDMVHLLMSPNPKDRPTAEEVLMLPLLEASSLSLRETSPRLDSELLDKMYAYSSFPLLKKAALVAMVTRAETDEDFGPSIEKFLSLDSNITSGLDSEDLYKALSLELICDMRKLVKITMGPALPRALPVPASARQLRRLHRSRKCADLPDAFRAVNRFAQDLKSDVEKLISKIDATGSRNISYSEWLAATASSEWFCDDARIGMAFRLFDADGDGRISEEDLKKVIPDVFQKLTVDAVLEESNFSASQTSGLSEDHFALLIKTENVSAFSLRRMAAGLDPILTPESVQV